MEETTRENQLEREELVELSLLEESGPGDTIIARDRVPL